MPLELAQYSKADLGCLRLSRLSRSDLNRDGFIWKALFAAFYLAQGFLLHSLLLYFGSNLIGTFFLDPACLKEQFDAQLSGTAS